MREAKLTTSLLALSFAVIILGTHQTGRFFPWVHGFVAVSAAILLVGVFSNRLSSPLVVVFSVTVAVALRIFVYVRPASMIGMDPDKYATGVNHVMQTGGMDAIAGDVPTYSVLSAFHLLNSIVSLVSGFTGRTVLIAIPLATGVILPLTGAVLAKWAVNYDQRRLATGIASVLGATTAIGVLFGYWPVPQVIAVLLWCAALIFLTRLFATSDLRAFSGALVVLTAAIFAHKISMLVPVFVAGATLLLYWGRVDEWMGRTVDTDFSRFRTSEVGVLLLLLGLGLFVQWGIMTDFVRAVILANLVPLLTGGLSIAPAGAQPTAAVPGNPGIAGILIRRADFLVLLPAVSIAGFWLWTRDRTLTTALLIGAAAVPIVLAGISIVAVQVAAPQRVILFGIPAFAAVIGIAASNIRWRGEHRGKGAALLLVLVLLAPQVGSAALAPDYDGEPRLYLTAGEDSAKASLLEHSESDVAMDFFYAREQVDVRGPGASHKPGLAPVPGVIELEDELLNRTLMNQSHDTILLREHADVIRFSRGGYRLTWNPIQELSNSTSHHRVFDNGHATGFTR
jgi:hypothetical protein